MYSLYHLKIIILHMPVFYNPFRHQKDKLQFDVPFCTAP